MATGTRSQTRRAAKAEEKPEWHGGPPEISSTEIKLDELIGEGSFGKVYSGTCRGVRVAIKVPGRQMTAAELQDLRTEVSLLSSIYHPNVVLFMGACTKEDQLMIVTELKDCSVESMLKKERERRRAAAMSSGGKGIYFTNSPTKSSATSNYGSASIAATMVSSPLTRMRMARDTALGTNWLHNISHIIHRDLKTANLLWDESTGRVCVTDFGLSQVLAPAGKAKDRFGPRGSALFMAPEVIREQEFDQRVDTYSFGIVLWELWTCEEPFSEFYDYDSFVDAVHLRGLRPVISSELYHQYLIYEQLPSSNKSFDDLKKICPPRLVALMKSCWSDHPSKRPSDFEYILHEIDQVIVELSMGSWTDAAEFWNESFCKEELREKVSWNDFVHAMIQATKIRDKSLFEPLAPFLLSSDGKYVLLSLFSDTVEWFGRFYSSNSEEARQTLIHIHNITSAPWFTGAITRQQAESHMNSKSSCPERDSFMVRLSASVPGCPFTITRPSHSTRRPNLRVRRIPVRPETHSSSSFGQHSFDSSSSQNTSNSLNHQNFTINDRFCDLAFEYVVDYGPDGFSAGYKSLPELIEGCKQQLRLYNPAPPITSGSGY